jgi:hypothetical protein
MASDVLIHAGRELGVTRDPPGVTAAGRAPGASWNGGEAVVTASGSRTLVAAHGAGAPHLGHTCAAGLSAVPQAGQGSTAAL